MTSPRSFREAFTEDPAATPTFSAKELADAIDYGEESWFWPGVDFGERGTVADVLRELRDVRASRDSARRSAVALENRIERALAEHQPVGGFPPDEAYCGTCVDAPGEKALRWPCPSVAALTGGGDDARP